MQIPVIQGVIDRRLLVNFRANPDDVARLLPPPFRPQLYKGFALVGICLIRLKEMRPKGLPQWVGFGSENGAHRIAVEWDTPEGTRCGVYIPRRDTSSCFNTAVGGRVFPGKHYKADFIVQETSDSFEVAFDSSDGTRVEVKANAINDWPAGSVFENLEAASAFYQKGDYGFSPNGDKLDGLALQTAHWQVKPLKASIARSSFFQNADFFQPGTVVFDNVLLMQQVPHEWHSVSAAVACCL